MNIRVLHRKMIKSLFLLLLSITILGCSNKNVSRTSPEHDKKNTKEGTLDSVTTRNEGKMEAETSNELRSITPVDVSILSISLREDYKALDIVNKDNIRSNITLATEGTYGSKITWTSSNDSIISDEEIINENYDSTPAGVVSRQGTDKEITLIARLDFKEEIVEKEFIVTVKAKEEKQELTDYLFTYFAGNGVGQESIHFSTSRDGFSYKQLNYGKPIITSELGTKGLRDPFILRSHEGDKFYLIATDLSIASDDDWWKAQTQGSTSIMIWESEDLVNWSKQRMVQVNNNTAGCTWAPEAFYDEITGEYVVFWASRSSSDNYSKQRIFYVKTRDFHTFTKPKVWIDYNFSAIDTTVAKEGDFYYRFTKYEDTSTILLERSTRLLGKWGKIESPSLEGQKGVEGPYCFLLNNDDRVDEHVWGLLLDNYGGNGYYLMVTESLETANFERKRGYSLPKGKPRHGTVMSITTTEYERLMEVYGTK